MKRFMALATLCMMITSVSIVVAKNMNPADLIVNCGSEGCSGDHGDDKRKE